MKDFRKNFLLFFVCNYLIICLLYQTLHFYQKFDNRLFHGRTKFHEETLIFVVFSLFPNQTHSTNCLCLSRLVKFPQFVFDSSIKYLRAVLIRCQWPLIFHRIRWLRRYIYQCQSLQFIVHKLNKPWKDNIENYQTIPNKRFPQQWGNFMQTKPQHKPKVHQKNNHRQWKNIGRTFHLKKKVHLIICNIQHGEINSCSYSTHQSLLLVFQQEYEITMVIYLHKQTAWYYFLNYYEKSW